MKWFQHQSNSSLDAKLQEILLDYGLEGYGLYWYCLELVSMNVEANNLTFELEHDCRIIARNTGSTPQKVTEMMTRFIDLGLFDQADGIITCMSLMKRCDEYTSKLLKTKVSGQCRDKVRSNRIEESTIEESKVKESRIDNNTKPIASAHVEQVDELFELFWLSGMAKTGKKKALASFKTVMKGKKEPDLFTNHLINDIKKRLSSNQFGFSKMHPTTYLNGERWNDEISINQQNTNQPVNMDSTGWSSKLNDMEQ